MSLRLAAVALLVAASSGCAHLNYNLRTVEEDNLYRAGQMPAEWLGKTIEREGIRTVVSLRSVSPEDTWYPAEVAVCEARGVPHYNLGWTMARPPAPASLAQYVDILETAERPILVHCQMGTHRAGTAAALFVLHEGGGADEAREQFTLLFMNAPIGNIVDWYEETANGAPFAVWARETYPGLYAERIDSGASAPVE